MQHIVDYLDRGGPVVGFRTATHAFQIKRPDAKFLKYTWKRRRRTTRAASAGRSSARRGSRTTARNHKQSSRLLLQADQATHPILRGVKDVWVQSGGYTADPIEGSTVLALGQILNGMTPDSPPAPGQEGDAGGLVSHLHRRVRQGRPRVHDDARRVRGSAERRVPADGRQRAACGRPGSRRASSPTATSASSGPFKPTTFSFGGFVKGVKPADLAGWDSPILPKTK